eukprot:UN04391
MYDNISDMQERLSKLNDECILVANRKREKDSELLDVEKTITHTHKLLENKERELKTLTQQKKDIEKHVERVAQIFKEKQNEFYLLTHSQKLQQQKISKLADVILDMETQIEQLISKKEHLEVELKEKEVKTNQQDQLISNKNKMSEDIEQMLTDR